MGKLQNFDIDDLKNVKKNLLENVNFLSRALLFSKFARATNIFLAFVFLFGIAYFKLTIGQVESEFKSTIEEFEYEFILKTLVVCNLLFALGIEIVLMYIKIYINAFSIEYANVSQELHDRQSTEVKS